MIIILLAAAVVSLVTVVINNTNPANEKESFADAIIIAVVVLLNAILGVVQESKAEQAIKALQSMTESTCKVLRDGTVTIVKSHELVVGDVVVLEAGDSVPADCRILQCASLKAEEAALTGESVPAEKDAVTLTKEVPLGDRKNMLYMGSTIVYGRAKAIVVATGMATEMGKIAHVLNSAQEEKTPLQLKMASLSKILTFVVIGICVVIFAFNLIMKGLEGRVVRQFHGGNRTCSGVHSRRIGYRRYHCAVHRRYQHEQEKRLHSQNDRRGNIGLCGNHLLRQDGHAYAKQNDGS